MAHILLQHRFRSEGEALARRSAELFELVYADKYDAETRKDMARIAKRHKSAFANKASLTVNCKGMRFDVGARFVGKHGARFEAKVKSPRPVFSACSAYDYIDCELAETLCEFADSDRQLGQNIDKAFREVMAVLASFSSERALAEGWPEAIPLIGHVLAEIVPGSNLPAVQIARLNAEFAIPPLAASEG